MANENNEEPRLTAIEQFIGEAIHQQAERTIRAIGDPAESERKVDTDNAAHKFGS